MSEKWLLMFCPSFWFVKQWKRAHDERHRNDKHKRRWNKSQDGDDEKRIDKKKENHEQHDREEKKKVLEEAKNDENREQKKKESILTKSGMWFLTSNKLWKILLWF